ncbi:hypothetical protein [Candidatus Regiella endosymbiont of Tuberolachnus salignus]
MFMIAPRSIGRGFPLQALVRQAYNESRGSAGASTIAAMVYTQ